jgi:hypothetical protein
VFQNVDAYAGDPILSLMEAFQQDPRIEAGLLQLALQPVSGLADRLQLRNDGLLVIVQPDAVAKGQPLSADGGTGALSPRGPDAAVWRTSSGVACLEARPGKDGHMVLPGRIADPDRGVGEVALEKIRWRDWRPIAARSRRCCLANIIRRCVPDASPPSRIGMHLEARPGKDGHMVLPGRIADPDRGVGEVALHPALRAGRIATIQTLGGSGALKVGADFLKRYFPSIGR